MILEMTLAGFLFLFILALNLVMSALGYKIELGDVDTDAMLQTVNTHPTRFKTSIVFALIEHVSIIVLAVLLFRVFGPYSLLLGIVWTTFRIGEGLIQSYNEINYWDLLNIAKQYSATSDAEQTALSASAQTLLQTKHTRFTIAMVFWSIGTLAYSILFIIYGLVPPLIGWLGIFASLTSGIGNGIRLIKPNFQLLSAIGGLSAILFEILIGGWLIYYSLII
ncbi:MAG: DUF4386 family protein [candidate division Zixibacteria bacterium]|nr:DUF4386 family protein [candidate division Zixibacteria bacterium]